MKTILLLAAALLFGGCATVPPVAKPLPDPIPIRGKSQDYAVRSEVHTAPAQPEHESANAPVTAKPIQDRQVIEALVAENAGLLNRLRTLERGRNSSTAAAPAGMSATVPSPVLTVVSPAMPVAEAPVSVEAIPLQPTTPAIAPATPAAAAAETALLLPNADGVIDVTALDAGAGSPNPFAVRAQPADASRELTIKVQAIVSGIKPCAVVNERLVEPGNTVESLRLTRLDADALILDGDRFTLKLPLGTTKVRLPL